MVEVFDNRVEISSPGSIPSDLKPEDFGTKSVVRNPVIASLLHRADYIEKIGTGISRIRNAVREHGKSSVEFIFTGFFTVRFSRGEPTVEKMSEKMSEKILILIKADPQISASELSISIGKTQRTIERKLSEMKKDGIIKRIGPDRGGHWDVLDE